MIGQRSRRRKTIAVLAIALLGAVLMTPNILWWLAVRTPASVVEGLLLPASLLLAVFALFGNRLWIACVVLTPFAVIAPAEIFYVATYGHPSTDQIIATIFATNPRETIEYFGGGLYSLMACAIVLLVIAVVAVCFAFQTHLCWRNRFRQWALVILFSVPVVFAVERSWSTDGGIGSRLNAGLQAVTSLSEILENGFPFGTIVRYLNYRQAWNAMIRAVASRDNFRFNIRATPTRASRSVIVLAIGESSRRDRWQLFGYARPTNPELSEIPDVIPVVNMVNSWSASIRAIPQVLTRKSITDNSSLWNEPSIIRAMQEAGFETWWISNQMPIGKFDSPVSMFALEAQHRIFLNRATYASSGSYDEALVQPLADLLDREPDRDLFVVLHMMGSHLRYDGRYPAEFKRFAPALSDHDTDAVDGERTGNSYDNTIAYTDHVLSLVIDVLHKHSNPSALLFESDHGETLPTPECSVSGHGIGDRFDFEVPAFFWFSNAYKSTHAETIDRLRANAVKRTLSADTFETIVDMSDSSYPGRDETWSLFSPQWRERTRLVNAGNTVDFDDAMTGKGCGILFSKDDKR